jgi:glycerol-3-phosphate responsive antiterminator
MYASVRKYLVDADRVDELMHRVDEKFAPRVEEMPGFVAYQVIDAGEDRVGKDIVFSVTICSDSEAVDRSVEMAAEFVGSELSDIEIERLEAASGEVSVSRAVSEVLEAAHA